MQRGPLGGFGNRPEVLSNEAARILRSEAEIGRSMTTIRSILLSGQNHPQHMTLKIDTNQFLPKDARHFRLDERGFPKHPVSPFLVPAFTILSPSSQELEPLVNHTEVRLARHHLPWIGQSS